MSLALRSSNPSVVFLLFSMTSPEDLRRFIEGSQKSDYVGLSLWVMFIWDYGESTRVYQPNHSRNRQLSIGPALSFDQEVSLIDLDKRDTLY
jgi:hypothetical protein